MSDRRRAPRRPLTHFDDDGQARMVEVGGKPATAREATASGRITMAPATARRIADRSLEKGDVLAVARLAAIQAVKRTADLVPLCHPLRITGVDVVLRCRRDAVEVEATVRAFDRTGVEMEALTAVTVAALTVYDMCKAIDRGMTLGPFALEAKQGGASGTWTRAGGRSRAAGRARSPR